MIRVYFDWNIISYLKTYKTGKEPFISLNNTLIHNRDHILIPYSSAHLSDLITSFKQSENGKSQTLEDLKYLETLTDNRCILYDYKTQETYPNKTNIKDYFFELLRSDEFLKGNFEDLFSSFGDYKDILNQLFNTLKDTPSGLNSESFEKMPSKYQLFKDTFNSTLENDSLFNLINDSYKIIVGYNTNPKLYKSIRNASLEDFKMNHDYSESDNPIEALSDKLAKSAFKKTFKEFVDENMKLYFKEKIPSRFDIFTNNYLMLDFLGYYKDSQFKNLLQDSFHAYYGAHCDFFVTDDDNTYHKAKAIYKYFNIETIVCKSSDFNTRFLEKKSIEEMSLFETINDIISTPPSIINQPNDENTPVYIHIMEHYLLDYFNRLQIRTNINKSVTLDIYKNSKNYSTFFFYIEIQKVTDKVYRELGLDFNNKKEFDVINENKELHEEKWEGRTWLINSNIIELRMKEAPFGLTLTITYFPPEYFVQKQD